MSQKLTLDQQRARYAWEKAGRIWYVTLTDKVSGDSDFQDFAQSTFAAAGEIYGAGSLEQKAVITGWSEVGIKVGGSNGYGPVDPGNGTGSSQSGCLQSLMSLGAVRWFMGRI